MTIEMLLQNFCYDTESIALYTNKESAPRLFTLLDSMGFTWAGSGEHPKPQHDNDLIFLGYETHQITHLPSERMFDTDYDDVVYFSADRFVNMFDQKPPF